MALIPPHYLNSVVSIGVLKKDNQDQLHYNTIATGFVLGKETGEKNDNGPLFKLFLITNRHVFFNKRENKFVEQVVLRFNTLEGKSHHFVIDLLTADKTPKWHKHEDEKVDLAVLPINAKVINDAKINYYFFNGSDVVYANSFEEKNISTGDDLFVLGFPMSISGKSRNFVIVRKGIIARVDEEILDEGYYYIDASAYPGNSGGPVIVKPEVVAINGTKSNSSAGLIGVISAGETYSDVAVSQHSGEPKVIFTEQTGLVRVVPIEKVFDVVDTIMKSEVIEAEVKDAGTEIEEVADGLNSNDD